MLFVLFEGDFLGQIVEIPIHAHADIARLARVSEDLDVLALALAHDGREDLELGALGQGGELVDDLVDGLLMDFLAALGAVGHADARPEQTEVVVNLGDRADGRAGVFGGRLLVDRDGGGEAVDVVDVGLVHLPEELAGVGGKGLDIAALPLGVDRVEGEGGLARAGQAGQNDELVTRDGEINIFEVVHTGTLDVNFVLHRFPFRGARAVMRCFAHKNVSFFARRAKPSSSSRLWYR